MSTKITVWPKVLKAVPVSTTASPVTQVAEVAVNRASRKGTVGPAWLAGLRRNAAPRRMAPAKT